MMNGRHLQTGLCEAHQAPSEIPRPRSGQSDQRKILTTYRISSVTEVTDKPALDELLLEYYGVIVRKFAAAGGPPLYTPEILKASFWPNLHKFLPPTGRLVLVHDDANRMVGCGTLQQARPGAGEFKRL